MRIAIVSDVYFPMTNGIAVFAHNLATGLAKRGHHVIVICPSFKGEKYIQKTGGVEIVHVEAVRLPLYPDQINEVPEKKHFLLPRVLYRHGIWVAPYPYPELKRALDRFRPNIIHIQSAESIALAARWYAKKRAIPIVATGHALPDNLTQQVKLIKPVKKPLDAVVRSYRASFLKHSAYATAPTEMAIEGLVKHKKIHVEALSNGVDLFKFRPGRPSSVLKSKYRLADCPRVLYVGRVDPEKSLSQVFKAFAMADVDAAELMIVGDGTDRPKLEKLAKKLNITQKTRFMGRVLSPELEQFYHFGSLFISASRTETQGISLIEAAASGLPLVAIDAGPVREICQDKINGFLCAPDDIEAMATAIRQILLDPKLQKQFAKQSLKIAKKHDLGHTLKRFEEIYQIALQQNSQKTKKTRKILQKS